MLGECMLSDGVVDHKGANFILAKFFGNTGKPCFPSLILVATLKKRNTCCIRKQPCKGNKHLA